VRADVHEVPAAEVLADEVELDAVEEAEEEVALEGLPQVESEPHSPGELGDRLAAAPHGQHTAQAALPAEVDAAEEGVDGSFQHGARLT
jgi:hypothetical protein